MKVVILAGGFGTRISEETHLKPKPMIEIGDKPVLWHIMKTYSHFGFNDSLSVLATRATALKNISTTIFYTIVILRLMCGHRGWKSTKTLPNPGG